MDIYADDTTITASAHFSDLCSMTQRLNSDLDAVQRWASCNKMFINKKKTKSLLVHGKRIPANLDDDTSLRLDVKNDNSVIEQVSSHKILGVVVDSQMNYESHIDELCKILSKRIRLLKHISPFLKQRQGETYYNGVIKCNGSMIWDSCNVEHLESILKLQKQAARIILDPERLTPSVVLFNNLNWLPFTKQSLIKRCALVYKRVYNYITPSYLNSLLVRNSEIHNRATRHSNINLMCPKYKRKTEGGRTFTIRTIKDWNCMNAYIRNNGSLASFKHTVFKSFLAEQKAAMLLRL